MSHYAFCKFGWPKILARVVLEKIACHCDRKLLACPFQGVITDHHDVGQLFGKLLLATDLRQNRLKMQTKC